MPPVGNDIVDLADPENIGKSSDQRFCRRVFNPEELSFIAGSDRPDTILWAIWAAKEAAYKAVSRGNPSVCSIPGKYPVFLEAGAEMGVFASRGAASVPTLQGKVITPNGELFLHICINEEMLHVIAGETAEALARIVFRVELVEANSGDPSCFVRKILIEEISRRFCCSEDDLSVAKEEEGPGAPFLLFRGSRLPAEISLSHDGRFVAFAFAPSTLR